MTRTPTLPPRPAYNWPALEQIGGTFAVPYYGCVPKCQGAKHRPGCDRPRVLMNRLNVQGHERYGAGGYRTQVDFGTMEVRIWRV